MDKEKQIMELARELCGEGEHYQDCFHCPTLRCCGTQKFARELYDKGWCKASDVAREIFEEIEENLNNLIRYYKEKRKYVTEIEYSELEQRYCDIKIRTFEERLLKIAELKKKYTEEK